MAEKTSASLVLVLNELMDSGDEKPQRVKKVGDRLRGESKVDISITLSRR